MGFSNWVQHFSHNYGNTSLEYVDIVRSISVNIYAPWLC